MVLRDFIVVFLVRSSHVRDHSVEQRFTCTQFDIVGEIATEKKEIESRLSRRCETLSASYSPDVAWVSVVVSNIVHLGAHRDGDD